ncbi:MAG: pepsin/retropepsin-like aspartic protease family protein [Bacteroidota bacterium]|nr:pepsin/retropepsin-like aspartic protease family protein [Bacteroidota bacterium]
MKRNQLLPFLVFLTALFCLPDVASCKPGKDVPDYSIIQTLFFPGNRISKDPVQNVPFVVSIPLKRVGQLFMIEASIDGESGNFMFDTGSQELVLNSIYFRKYIAKDEQQSGGITGMTDKVTRTVVRRLDISGIVKYNISADVMDLGHLENRRGVKIFGLFGFSVFRDMEVIIDVNRNQLMLYRLDKKGKRFSLKDAEFRCDITQRCDLYKNIVFLKSSIGGKILTFCLDTGAESNVLSSWLPRKIMDHVIITRRSNLTGMGKARADVFYGLLNDFRIEGKIFSNMPVIITSLENMSASFDHPLDGMLGYDFLEKGVLSINLVTRDVKIAFEKGGRP